MTKMTPLLCAADSGHTECVRFLLQCGADANQRSTSPGRGGWTLAHYAAVQGNTEMLLAALDASCDVDAINSDGDTSLTCAVREGQTDCVRLLLQRGANVRTSGYMPANIAAERGNKEMLLALLDAGCEADEPDWIGDTPLMLAAKTGNTDCVQLLLQRGADGRSCAHLAAEGGHKETLLALLDAGCAVDATDRWNRTPLIRAAGRGHTDCVRLLLQRGANAQRTADFGTLAHYAAERGNKEMLLALLDAGCEVDAKANNSYFLGHTPLTLFGEFTPLMLAADRGHKDCVQLLLQRCADVHMCTDFERTVAHLASKVGDKETLLAVLDAGCPVDTKDLGEMTPLLYAASGGYADCMELLLQRGADPNCRSKDGFTAASYAALRNADALRVALAAVVHLPMLDELFPRLNPTENFMKPISDPISLALACGCRLDSSLCSIEEAAHGSHCSTEVGL